MNYERTLVDAGIDVPEWIEQDLTFGDVENIAYSGCTSGAYKPAATHCQALNTMYDFGDDVLEFIEECYGEIPAPKDVATWSGLACYFLSLAVELFCQSIEGEVR